MFYLTTVSILIIYTISYFLYKSYNNIEQYTFQKNIENIDIIYHSLYIPILCYYCTQSIMLINYHSQYNRLVDYNSYGDIFLKLYISNNIIHNIVILLKSRDKKYIISMTIHHMLSSYSYYYGILSNNCLYYGLLAGLCEFTVIPLNNIHLFKLFSINNNYITKLNSILLWISWIFFRIILFLYLIYQYIYDYNYIYHNMNKYHLINYTLFVIIILFILNITWFILIHKGLIKTLKK